MKHVAIIMMSILSFVANATPAEDAIALAQDYANNATPQSHTNKWFSAVIKTDPIVATAIDGILSTCAFPPSMDETTGKYLPRTFAAYLARLDANGYHVLARHLSGEKRYDKMTRDEAASFWFELIGTCPTLIGKHMDKCQKTCMEAATYGIRRKLRSEGKSIVIKDGVNPVMAAVSPVADALNRPKFSGLSEALANCGCSIHVCTFPVPEGNVLTAFTNKVYMGDITMTEEVKGKLRYALGTDAYNAFIDLYNGDN